MRDGDLSMGDCISGRLMIPQSAFEFILSCMYMQAPLEVLTVFVHRPISTEYVPVVAHVGNPFPSSSK